MPDSNQNPVPMPPVNKTKTIAAPGQRKKVMMISGGILILLIIIAGGLYAMNRGEETTEPGATPTAEPTPTPTPTPTTAASMLNGEIVANELATRHPLAIMIENHPDARPQSGLSDASIVYEAITEGGITRFMGLFAAKLPPKAGPVRSARQVYVDFAKEYTPKSAYYAHVGGSAIALGMIKTDGVLDMDQGGIGTKAFQRIPRAGIATEHTMFTYPDKLYQVAKDRKFPEDSTFTTWKFKDDAAVDARPATQSVTIPFSSASYDVKFVYDKTTNTYNRFLAGIAHNDANTGKQIAPKNVIVQFVNYTPVQSATKIVQDVSVVGEGTAKIVMDGKVVDAKWKRGSGNSRTIYTDATTGAEIQFDRGQIWICLPKIGTTVTVL